MIEFRHFLNWMFKEERVKIMSDIKGNDHGYPS